MASASLPPSAPEDCPCGNRAPYDACCGPLHRNERPAAGVEELMRSRYSAYAVGAWDHLFRTWHPRTRPEDVAADPDLTWTGLEVLEVEQGEDTGTVVFRARWTVRDSAGVLAERSEFVRRGGRWVYLQGT